MATTTTQRLPTMASIRELTLAASKSEPLTEAEKVRQCHERVEKGWRLDTFIDEIGKVVSLLRQQSGRSGARLVPVMRSEGFVAYGIAPLEGEDVLRLCAVPDAYIGTIGNGEFFISTPLPRDLYAEADNFCRMRGWNLKVGSRIDWRT